MPLFGLDRPVNYVLGCSGGWLAGPSRFSTLPGKRNWVPCRQTMVRCLVGSPPANLRCPGAGATLAMNSYPVTQSQIARERRSVGVSPSGAHPRQILVRENYGAHCRHTLATKLSFALFVVCRHKLESVTSQSSFHVAPTFLFLFLTKTCLAYSFDGSCDDDHYADRLGCTVSPKVPTRCKQAADDHLKELACCSVCDIGCVGC